MISISTSNYLAIVRAAQVQNFRSGAPTDGKQSVSVAVEQQRPPPVPPSAASTVSKIVDVMV